MRHSIFKHGVKTFWLLSLVLLIFTLAFAFSVTASTETITYNYYDTGELKKTVYSGATILEYEYDDSGNRISQIIISSKPAISVSPSSLGYGSITVGSATTQSIQIANTGNWTLEIEGIGIDTSPSDFSTQGDTCSGQALTHAASCTINVVFSPSSAGSKAAYLNIASNAPDSPNLQVSLAGQGISDQKYPLIVTKTGSGIGDVTVNPGSLTWTDNTGTVSYAPGTNVNISAIAQSDSIFNGWFGDCSGNGSPCSLQMSSPLSVTAAFSRKVDFSATPTSVMAQQAVQFTDKTDTSLNPTAWAWDFGDGNTSTLQNPSHTYTTSTPEYLPRYYNVKLTSYWQGGNGAITKNNYITVWSCINQPVKISGSLSYYTTIQNAYANTPDGDAVQMMGKAFPEALTLQSPYSVTLQGGYECDFSSNPGYTTINSPLTIQGGAVIIENVIIK